MPYLLCSIGCMPATDERYWDAEVTSVAVTDHWRLHLEFADGYSGDLDVSYLRRKPGLFKDLRDPDYFARAFLDEEQGTVAWPNGVDVAAPAGPYGPAGETPGVVPGGSIVAFVGRPVRQGPASRTWPRRRSSSQLTQVEVPPARPGMCALSAVPARRTSSACTYPGAAQRLSYALRPVGRPSAIGRPCEGAGGRGWFAEAGSCYCLAPARRH
jgi:Protein of unknown function (DUF2442)